MHIFKNTHYNFLRWRWHALVVSWAIIIAGIYVIATRGIPKCVEFAGGTGNRAEQGGRVQQSATPPRTAWPARRRGRTDCGIPGRARCGLGQSAHQCNPWANGPSAKAGK